MAKTRKQIKRESQTRTLFKVPNTVEGQAFLESMRAYATGGTRVWARGRGPRAVHSRAKYGENHGRGFDQQLPQELATYFGVYVTKTSQAVIDRTQLQRLYVEAYQHHDAKRKLDNALPELERLNADRGELMKQRDALQFECQRLRDSRKELLGTIEQLRKQSQADYASNDAQTINIYINSVNLGEA